MAGALAIDYGTKKCGFAYADRARIVVRPLEALRHEGRLEDLTAFLRKLFDEREVGVVVLGWPLHLDGTAGTRVAETEAFARELERLFPGVKVTAWDERLSTKEAESRLHEAGYRGREAKQRKDSWAAWILLQDWIAAGEPLQRAT